jgi:enamine deaminase RidA (YjgF/YER057c/UK114 family)
MSRRRISSGSSFEKAAAYARAVVDGDWVFVSGTTGFDYAAMTIVDDAGAQAEQALRNIDDALKQAGASFADIVRVRCFVAPGVTFETIAPIFQRWFAAAPPANTTVVSGFLDPRMMIEIEVTAHRSR